MCLPSRSPSPAGAATFTGRDRKVWEAKQLAAVGGMVVHKEKMPMKMAMGVMAVRGERCCSCVAAPSAFARSCRVSA